MDSKNYLKLASRFSHFVSFAAQKIEKAKKQASAKNMVGSLFRRLKTSPSRSTTAGSRC